jgi:hypothetical protein
MIFKLITALHSVDVQNLDLKRIHNENEFELIQTPLSNHHQLLLEEG